MLDNKLKTYKAIDSELDSLKRSVKFYTKTAADKPDNKILWHIEKVIQKDFKTLEELFSTIKVDLPEEDVELNLNLIEDIIASTDFTEEEVVNSLIVELKQRI